MTKYGTEVELIRDLYIHSFVPFRPFPNLFPTFSDMKREDWAARNQVAKVRAGHDNKDRGSGGNGERLPRP